MPAFHAGRVHQFLPLPAALKGQEGETGPGSIVVAGQPSGAHHQLGGTLDVGIAGLLEEVRIEQRPQNGANVSIRVQVSLDQDVDGLRVIGRRDAPGRNLRFIGDKEIVEVAGQEPGRILLLDHDVNDVFAIEVAGLAQEMLFAVVVVFRLELIAPVETAHRLTGWLGADSPAGKGAGCFLNVVLGVVADAHGEQLQQLAAPVFVD